MALTQEPESSDGRVYYHVTPKDNLHQILRHGLTPQLGERSVACGELLPRVYLFTSLDSCETALDNWLGEVYEAVEEGGLVILEIDARTLQGRCEVVYEWACESVIPPGCILRVLDESFSATSLLHL